MTPLFPVLAGLLAASGWAVSNLASRRASARSSTRPCSARSRSSRAASASFSPCSIRSRRAVSIPESGLKPNAQMTARKTMKLSALTITQKRLIVRPPVPVSAAVIGSNLPIGPAMTARNSTSFAPEMTT